jgi:hypothetical protein
MLALPPQWPEKAEDWRSRLGRLRFPTRFDPRLAWLTLFWRVWAVDHARLEKELSK